MRKSHNEFLNPELSVDNLDRYVIRSGILAAIKQALPQMSGIILDVGCGQMPYKSMLLSSESSIEKYIGLDLIDNKYSNCSLPDVLWDGISIPLANEAVDCAIATEVFEHCPYPEIIMKEINRVLKPEGVLFFTVPFLWPLHDIPHDEYRYTPFSLERHLKHAGFAKIDLKALGGWDASLAQMLGLWVRRRWKSSRSQHIFRVCISPFVRAIILLLTKLDQVPESFSESSMITGIAGVAKK